MKGDTPNLTALGMTMHELNTISSNDFRILEFIHDRQNEFSLNIEEMQQLTRTVKSHWGNLSMPDMTPIEKPVIAKLTFGDYRDYEGLQLADIMLLLFRRRNCLTGGCARLFEEISGKIYELFMNPKQMIRDTESYIAEVNNIPISEEKLRKGLELRAELEKARKRRIVESYQQIPKTPDDECED